MFVHNNVTMCVCGYVHVHTYIHVCPYVCLYTHVWLGCNAVCRFLHSWLPVEVEAVTCSSFDILWYTRGQTHSGREGAVG